MNEKNVIIITILVSESDTWSFPWPVGTGRRADNAALYKYAVLHVDEDSVKPPAFVWSPVVTDKIRFLVSNYLCFIRKI